MKCRIRPVLMKRSFSSLLEVSGFPLLVRRTSQYGAEPARLARWHYELSAALVLVARPSDERNGDREFLYLHVMRWQSVHTGSIPSRCLVRRRGSAASLFIRTGRAVTDGFCISPAGFTFIDQTGEIRAPASGIWIKGWECSERRPAKAENDWPSSSFRHQAVAAPMSPCPSNRGPHTAWSSAA